MATPHFIDGCTCTDAGEDPECPHHGYEAIIRRLEDECERLRLRNRQLSMGLLRVFPGAGTTNAALRLAAELPTTRHLVRDF